jgi:hypothetical protein
MARALGGLPLIESSLPDPAAVRYATRRADPGATEQQHGLVEQLGTELRGSQRAAQSLEQPEQATDHHAALFGDAPCWTGEHRSRRRQPSMVCGFGDEGAESHEQMRAARTRIGDDRAMSVQQRQIEYPVVQPTKPLGHALPGDPVPAGSGLE